MSRSGYSDDCDGWALIRWRGAVASAIRGKRGQAFLREVLAALDAIEDKRLIFGELVDADGEFCALGAVGHCRGIDLKAIDYEDREAVAKAFGIPEALAAEIMFENDDDFWFSSGKEPEHRWRHMRNWVAKQIKDPALPTPPAPPTGI